MVFLNEESNLFFTAGMEIAVTITSLIIIPTPWPV